MSGKLCFCALLIATAVVSGADRGQDRVPKAPSAATNAPATEQTFSTVHEMPGYKAHLRYAAGLDDTTLERERAWKVYKSAIGTNSILRVEVLPKQQYVTTGERDTLPTLHKASWTPLPREERIGPQPGITLFRFTRLPFDPSFRRTTPPAGGRNSGVP